MLRTGLFIVLATIGLAVGTAVPAAAINPGPPQIPGLLAGVQDACTHQLLPAVQTTMTNPAGRVFTPARVGTGSFRYHALAPGTYRLFVSAPGYTSLADAAGLGVTVTVNPGPTQVPAGDFVTIGLHLGIRLVPQVPPGPCLPPGAAKVPGAIGTVHDAATGALISGMAVKFTDPTTGLKPPGPGCAVAAGRFSQKQLPAGTWQLHLTAPGYVALKSVPVEINPGPVQLPGGASVATGLEIAVGLGARRAAA